MENLRVGIVQFAPSHDRDDNRAIIDEDLDNFDEVDLVVLPEYSAWYDPDHTAWAAGAETLDGEFVRFLTGNAARRDATIIAGMLVSDGEHLTNTIVAITGDGVIGRYDKVHLYDAFGTTESSIITPGDPSAAPLVVDVRGWTVGVQTCYDLRFPESSRRLIDAGATVLAVPADWVPGPNKREHWHTLLRARAIENIAWVVAANHAEPSGTGDSMIVDPLGTVVLEAGTAEFIGDATLAVEAVSTARHQNPALANRRYGVTAR